MLISPSWQSAPGGGKNNEITPICPPAGRRALPPGVVSAATARYTHETTHARTHTRMITEEQTSGVTAHSIALSALCLKLSTGLP